MLLKIDDRGQAHLDALTSFINSEANLTKNAVGEQSSSGWDSRQFVTLIEVKRLDEASSRAHQDRFRVVIEVRTNTSDEEVLITRDAVAPLWDALGVFPDGQQVSTADSPANDENEEVAPCEHCGDTIKGIFPDGRCKNCGAMG